MGVTPASDPPWSILVFTRQRCVSFKLMGLNNLVRRPPSYQHFFRRARIWRCCGGDPEETPSKRERLNMITVCLCIGQGHTGCWIGFCENRPPRPTAPQEPMLDTRVPGCHLAQDPHCLWRRERPAFQMRSPLSDPGVELEARELQIKPDAVLSFKTGEHVF